MAVCGALLLTGLWAVAAWGGLAVRPPPPAPDGGGGQARIAHALRRYLWWAALVCATGLVTGILVAGAGGRLAMRLLAATSPQARGALTEAGETVGRISLGGTAGFVVFSALPFAMLAAALYAVLLRWLPAGRGGGALFGLLLLVAAGTRAEPLRADNPDFAFLGPSWLAVLTFGLLVLAAGMLTAAFMGWYSRRLPLLRRSSSAHYLATVLLLMLVLPVGAPVLVLVAAGAGLVAVAALVSPAVGAAWASRRVTAVGRAVLVGGTALALPGFAHSLWVLVR